MHFCFPDICGYMLCYLEMTLFFHIKITVIVPSDHSDSPPFKHSKTNPTYFQEQVEEMRKKEERMEKQMNEVMAENRRLIEPLHKAKEEVHDLHKQVNLGWD